MSYVKIKGFEPDADPAEPGVLTNCDLILPTLNGVRAFPGNADPGIDAVASAVAAAVSITKLDNSNEVYAATRGATSIIYKLSGTTWSNFKEGAGSFSANSAAQWTFAQLGDQIFAAQLGDAVVRSTTATASFQTLSATAGNEVFKARIIETVLDFAVAFNIDDTDYDNNFGSAPDRWRCSEAGNGLRWKPSIATQATTGRLTDYPGPITAAKRLGSNLVAYKRESMFLGQYVGAPEVWRWRGVPGEGLGTWGPYSVVDIETAHLFWGFDNAYIFDGTRPTPIATNRVAMWFFENLNIEQAHLIRGFHDRQKFRVIWWFPSSSGKELDRYVAYNYRSDRWAQGEKTIQTTFEFLTPSVTYDGLNTFFSTTAYNDLPTASYNEWQPTSSTPTWTIFDLDNKIYTLTGTPGTSSITTGVVGDDDVITGIDRARPRFKKAPSVGAAAHITLDVQGGDESTATSGISLYRGGFDHVQAARWHKYKMDFTGNMEITGIKYRIFQDSEE